MGEHNHNNGMNTWRAGCSGSCTSGSEGGPGKPTSREADRAPRSDPYTYIPTRAGFLYLATVIDIWSRRVVGWSIRNDLTTPPVTDALNMALTTRRPDQLIHHSDRGSPHTSAAFRTRCERAGISVSMGRRGDAYDKAVADIVLRHPRNRTTRPEPIRHT